MKYVSAQIEDTNSQWKQKVNFIKLITRRPNDDLIITRKVSIIGYLYFSITMKS